MNLIVYDTAEESVFLVSGSLGCIYIAVEGLGAYSGDMGFADDMGVVFLEVILSPGWLT